MHLLQGGVNLVYIRDILGHSSVKVTNPKPGQILNLRIIILYINQLYILKFRIYFDVMFPRD